MQAALPPPGMGAGGFMRAVEPDGAILRTRTYDLYITYDQVRSIAGQVHHLYLPVHCVCLGGM
jgi:hypothetical protein